MRLFFALWPPAETAAALAAWAAQAQAVTGGRTTRADKIHLTLAFLGEVSEDRVGAAIRAARRVRAEPYVLPIEQAKLWSHNRIVWVGPLETPAALTSLAQLLRQELAEEDFVLERRLFVAHVTLIRKARQAVPLPPMQALRWPVAEFCLVRSKLSGRDTEYDVIGKFPLGA